MAELMDNVQIKAIRQVDPRTLGIVWTDGKEHLYDVVELRRRCPCASCVNEWTHERTLKPEDVPESVRPERIDSVGRYAMNIKFNDGHGTGIYTYQMLRQLS